MIRVNLLHEVLAQGRPGKGSERSLGLSAADLEGSQAPRGGVPWVAALVALLVGSLGGVHALLVKGLLTKASARKVQLERERRAYDPYISLEKTFRDRREALQRKEEVMTALKRQQALPVHLLEELASSLPQEVWFRKLSQKGALVTIEGEARNFESINAFFNNLQGRSRWFRRLSYPGAKRGATGSFEFTISFELQNGV
jgi:Tfp pilus assembly protein PilN